MRPEVLRYAAFTTGGCGGNPAGVVLGAAPLTAGQMLAVAQTIGYSETAFVDLDGEPTTSGPRGAVGLAARVRFFSPVAEVAFCGHATVATAVALAERHGPGRLDVTTSAGPVPVTTRREGGELVATLTSPPAGTTPVGHRALEEALAALRWTPADLDPRYPPRIGSAGNRHLLLAVRDRTTLASLDYDYPRLAALMARRRWTTAHLFWAQDATTFHARDPFPPGGVVEDPATGAAAAAFGGYLRELDLLPALPVRVVVHQGHDMGSPSRLLVDLAAGTRTVRVSGAASRLAPHDEETAEAPPSTTDHTHTRRSTS